MSQVCHRYAQYLINEDSDISPLANALQTSATIFETLADIDSKFAKIVDKEYDTVSNEVKKWFKKLAVGLFAKYLFYYKLGCIIEGREGT